MRVDHREQLADAVVRAGWQSLLPAHRSMGDGLPVGEPACVDVLWLADELAVLLVADGAGRLYPSPAVVEGSEVRRAAPGDGAAEALVALLADGHPTSGRFRATCWQRLRPSGERAITVDQTNESVVVGDAAVVKWCVVADPGPHPAPSLLAELEAAGFTGMPRPWGVVEWLPARGGARLLATVSEYVTAAVDGWTWAVDLLSTAVSSGDTAPLDEAAAAVGCLLADFHRGLAGTAEPVRATTTQEWVASAVGDLDRALEVTAAPTRDVLTEREAALRTALEGARLESAPLVRVHGDLHVGQVLRRDASDGPTYLLTDFDGNPVVPPAERIRKQPASADVAGMAQSLLHVGIVVRKHHPELEGRAVDVAAEGARSAFLDAYRERLGDQRRLLDERLLHPFALRQVCREFTYAATHLPRWSYVPESALPALLAEGP